uniref:ATP-binding protein n=1 Tax=Nocardiopsis dassonvillei TaxID=2014 RepID=UPI00157D4DB1
MGEHAGGPGAVTWPDPDPAEPIVGRDMELARLFRAVDSTSTDRVLVLVGDPGMGKSALLGSAARRAEASGARVLRAEGSESESGLAFSALHQLLRPVSARVDALPERQRTAVRDAFGAGSATAESDPMLIGVAVLSLLSALGDRRPLLVVLDDAQWFDRASLDVLSFAARRLEGEPVTMLFGVRAGDRLAGLDRHLPTLALEALGDAAANRLLDMQPGSPVGRVRARILDQAGGNPLALTELTRASAAHDAAAGPPSPGPLPLTDHLEGVFAARLNDLPASSGQALLLLAAMDSVDSAIVASVGLPHAGDDAWLPAERAGLVRRTGRDVRFRHPLARSATYHAASPASQREAHLALAGILRDEPDRRAWHLAAACPGPDAAVSAELERTADRARRRGGHAAAASALRRAAELAPRREDRARLLVEAASAAVFTGDISWVEELAAEARAHTEDPSLLASVTAQVGRLAVLTVRHTVVFSRLVRSAEQAAVSRPATALDLLADAAVVRFYSGEDAQRRRIQAVLERLPGDASHAWPRAWVRAVSDPFEGRAELLSLLPRLVREAERQPDRLTALAVMAWLLDETPQAVRAFDEAFDRWKSQGPLPEGLEGAAAWSYVEQGRWDRAREACARTAAVGARAGLDHAVACAAAVEATVLAYQGDTAAARARVGDVFALIDPLESRSVSVYARRALGAAAVAEGGYEDAYDQLRMVFTADGAPVHYHASYPALADLAAAAARGGRRAEAA